MKVSICIPQYNRIEYLIKNLKIISQQTYEDIEVVISDDNSTDETEKQIKALMPHYKYPLVFKRNEQNRGFDRNLRQSLELASGDYLLVLGNDDSLTFVNSVERLVQFLQINNFPEIGFCNYVEEVNQNSIIKRASQTKVFEGTPETAIKFYKSFSFVAGIIFKRQTFLSVNTSKFDGSIYAQVYLAMKTILSGNRFFTIEDPLVLKDITIPGRQVNSYRDSLIRSWRDYKVVDGGLLSFTNVAVSAMTDAGFTGMKYPYRIIKDIYRFTLPYWILDYRKNNAFVNAVGIFRGLQPSFFSSFSNLNAMERFKLKSYYYFMSLIAFAVPVPVYKQLQHSIYALFKK